MPALAYLLKFTTYGSWLHGDDRGSFRHGLGYQPPRPEFLDFHRMNLAEEVVTLCRASRDVVLRAIITTCSAREWQLDAAHVRTQHVHAVVRGADPPEKMIASFKAWSTRLLREARLAPQQRRLWTRHGSTLWLWNEEQRAVAAEYVYDRQGEPMARYP